MAKRLQQVIAWWFVLQIVMPFTAPLQTLDVHDLFGVKNHRAASSPESTTTPTMSASTATTAVSVLTPAGAHGAVAASALDELTARGSLSSDPRLLPSPHVQRSVLRL
jgi:hypothetical protein